MSTPPAEGSVPESNPEGTHDPYAALRVPSFRRYMTGNLIALFGMQMQAVAVGWEIWERTNSNLAVGLIGLVQVAPVLLFSLPSGQLADRFNRKILIQIALSMLVCGSLGLTAASFYQAPIPFYYACLLLNGISRALQQPSKSSMLPHLVPVGAFSNAVTWQSSAFELASIGGPAVSGVLIAWLKTPALIYFLEAASSLIFLVLLFGVDVKPQIRTLQASTWASLKEGIAFVGRTKVILGAMSLDLFAVLLGGALTLLPVYSSNVILNVGPEGLGWMRAAPSVGALLMAFTLAHRPPMQHAGRSLLWAVAGFGVATIVFGFSRSFPLSLAALLLSGAFDMVSVVVRQTLVQVLAPDHMRGRVSAVNGMFIGASNELGGFESGLVAHLFRRTNDPAFGPTVSVVSGGLGTMAVVAFIAWFAPELRRYGRLDKAPRAEEPTEKSPAGD